MPLIVTTCPTVCRDVLIPPPAGSNVKPVAGFTCRSACELTAPGKPSSAGSNLAVLTAGGHCDGGYIDRPADPSCCEPDPCREPHIIITPAPDAPTPGKPVLQPGGGIVPGSAGCPPGYVQVSDDNSLGIPGGCYPNNFPAGD